MLSAASPVARRVSAVPYADPIAQDLLGHTPVDNALGVFVNARSRGLGIFGIDDAIIAAAIPAVTSAVRGIAASNQAITDPISKIWQALPASAIGAHVGSDGWWYDNVTNQRLSHEEAATKQMQVTAATIGATVGADGWWVKDGQQLTHAQAWALYQQLSGITPAPNAGGPTLPGGTGGSHPGVPLVPHAPINTGVSGLAGLDTKTLLILGGAVALFFIFGKKR